MVVKVWVQASSFGGGVYKEERSKPLMDIMGVSVTCGDESKGLIYQRVSQRVLCIHRNHKGFWWEYGSR